MMKNHRLQRIDAGSPLYEALLDLRQEALRTPLGLVLRNEDLSADKQDAIFIATDPDDNDALLACVMLHPKPDGVRKLRQMAVRADLRGQGFGKAIVAFAEQAMWAEGCRLIELNARQEAIPFYQKLGYTLVGGPFTEVGIPHRRMIKAKP